MQNNSLFFCVLGCLTAFFNEMSYPIVTLGIPLLLYLIMEEGDWKKSLYEEILLSTSWGLGYAGMWAGKWICASILTDKNYFRDALNQANSYVVTEISEPTLLDRIWKNISVIARWPYLIVIVVVLLVIIKKQNKREFLKCKKIDILKRKIPFMILMMYPIVTYIALGNGYSYNHYWFSYRLLAITVAAGVYLFELDFRKIK